MPRNPALIAGLLTSLAAVSAYAQAPDTGRLRGFVFHADGVPVTDATIRVASATVARTDREGMFVIELPPVPVRIGIQIPGRAVLETRDAVPIFAGQETELIATLTSTGASFDVESPARADAPVVSEATAAPGTVRGRVRSEKTRQPVVGARVFVRGTAADARTDATGTFTLPLPEGSRELTVIHPDHSTTTASVTVAAGREVSVEIAMAEKSLELAEVVVTAPRIEGTALQVLEERRDSASVAEVLGADQIAKAGDSDAAGALSRVTGITVVGGRYVYVRGLGERYSSTQLNGSNLPSPDPERRVVPLDLFPASAIKGITVQKTFSPDLPGEFGGGAVQIETRDIPEELSLSVGLSGRYVTGSSFVDGLSSGGGGTDFLGFGAGARALPDEFRELAKTQIIRQGDRFNPGLTAEDLERLGEQLDPVAAGTPTTLPADFGLSLEGGGKFDLLGARAGALLAIDYSNSHFLNETAFTNYAISSGTLELSKNFQIAESQNEIALSTLGSFALDPSDDHQLRVTVGVFRISLDRAQRTTGLDTDVGGPVEIHVLDWTERMVNTNQIRGTHALSKDLELELDWRYQLSIATSEQPNRRFLRYVDRGSGLETNNEGNERFYASLFDVGHQLGADLTMPVALLGGTTTLAAGFDVDLRDRVVDARRYYFKRTGSGGDYTLPPDRIFQPDVIGTHLVLEENTRNDDNYVGAQSVVAGYAMVDLGIGEALSIRAGARLEVASQSVDTRAAVASAEVEDDGVAAELDRIDVLPAVTATWGFVEDMQLRAAFAQTVNRPNFRELSPGAFIDQTRGLEYRGNPELERAKLYHGDLRWEWYPSAGESLSLAGFVKYIEDPIESALDLGSNPVARPINTEEAINLGFEIEGRKSFGFLGAVGEDFYVAGNFTVVHSRVALGDQAGVLTSQERALQGQSPFALNAQAGYENLDWGFAGTVLFNVFGARISEVGLLGVPDVFEQPQPTLDVVLKQSYGRLAASLKLQNLLDPAVRYSQEEPATGRLLDRERYEKGRRLTLSLTVDLD